METSPGPPRTPFGVQVSRDSYPRARILTQAWGPGSVPKPKYIIHLIKRSAKVDGPLVCHCPLVSALCGLAAQSGQFRHSALPKQYTSTLPIGVACRTKLITHRQQRVRCVHTQWATNGWKKSSRHSSN